MLIVILTSWLAFIWWFSPPTGEQYVLRLPGNPCPPGYSMVVPVGDHVTQTNN
jgi:hypothetical protein